MKIIGVAGGSGSGKSALSYRLTDEFPEKIEMVNLDDYHKVKTRNAALPTINGIVNWDHPDIVRWRKLIDDLKTLQKGIPVTIESWSHRSNPDYFKHRKKIPRTIYPKEILICDGYLSLWYEGLRKLFSRKYYLDLDQKTSLQRRVKFVSPQYEKEILIPMHKKYVEPTKKFADVVLNVSKLGADEVFHRTTKDLKKSNIL